MFTCKSSSSYCTLGPALRRLRHVPIPKLFWLEGLELTQAETALQGFQNRQVTSCGGRAAPDIAFKQFPTQRPESRERCHPQLLPRMAILPSNVSPYNVLHHKEWIETNRGRSNACLLRPLASMPDATYCPALSFHGRAVQSTLTASYR